MGYSLLQGISTCCGVGSFSGRRVTICSTVVFHRQHWRNLLQYDVLHRLKRNLCSSTWSTSPLVSAGLFLTFSVFTLRASFTLSYSCYYTGAINITGWLSFGQQWVCLEASWNWLCLTCGKLLTSSHRSQPCSFPHYQNLAMQCNTVWNNFHPQ